MNTTAIVTRGGRDEAVSDVKAPAGGDEGCNVAEHMVGVVGGSCMIKEQFTFELITSLSPSMGGC